MHQHIESERQIANINAYFPSCMTPKYLAPTGQNFRFPDYINSRIKGKQQVYVLPTNLSNGGLKGYDQKNILGSHKFNSTPEGKLLLGDVLISNSWKKIYVAGGEIGG